MIDPSVSGPTRPALFVERDRAWQYIRRRLVHACTREEWQIPALRARAIAACWESAVNLRAEGEELVSPSPVVLYRDPLGGDVVCADIRQPGASAPLWIDPTGLPMLFQPRLSGLVREPTTYAHWAEGPLPYMGDDPDYGADPLEDRELQYVRHQNSALRAAIDAAVAPSLDRVARDAGHPELIDFRVRGVFRRASVRVLESRQTDGDAKLVLDGVALSVTDLIPTEEAVRGD